MNPIQRSPLFLSNPFLSGFQSPSPMLSRLASVPQAAAPTSLYSSAYMGGGVFDMLGSLFQMFNYMSLRNQPGRAPSATSFPPSPAPAQRGGGDYGSAALPPDGAGAGAYQTRGAAKEKPEAGGYQARGAGEPEASAGAAKKRPKGGPAEGETAEAEAGKTGGQPTPGGEAAERASGGSKPSRSGEANLDRWDAQIQAAAESTGLPANYIKATVWAESRGNPETKSHNDGNGHTDHGLMQISDHTYGLVMKSQPKAPRGLKADNPDDNIMMGAWELKDKSEKAGGDLFKTSKAYVGTGDAHEEEYAGWVQTYKKELDEGKKLSDF